MGKVETGNVEMPRTKNYIYYLLFFGCFFCSQPAFGQMRGAVYIEIMKAGRFVLYGAQGSRPVCYM
jgi:hypothetical protein